MVRYKTPCDTFADVPVKKVQEVWKPMLKRQGVCWRCKEIFTYEMQGMERHVCPRCKT